MVSQTRIEIIIKIYSMKKGTLLFIALIFSVLFSNCKKDEGASCYNLKSFEIGVTPAENKIRVLFRVLDPDNNGVPNLVNSDFIVKENGALIGTEAQANFSPNQINFTVKTVLLLDISSSVTNFIQQIKDAAIALINMKLANQQIAIYVFDKNIRMLHTFSNDATSLIAAVNTLNNQNLQRSTNLYGSIIEIANAWTDSYSIEHIVDGSMVVFTDGSHNADPTITLSQAIAAVKTKKVFIAALQSADLSEDPLKQIVAGSAYGRYMLATDSTKLQQTFKDVQTKIKDLANSLYYLTYISPISSSASHQNTLDIGVKMGCGVVQETFDSKDFH